MTVRVTSRNEAVAALLASGLHSLYDVAECFGVSSERIRQIAICHGVATRRGPGLVDPIAVMRVIRDPVLRVTSCDEVASWARCGPDKVRRVLKEMGWWKPIQRLFRWRRLASMPHGTTSRYSHGCRCPECRAAISAYERHRRSWLRPHLVGPREVG